MSRSRNSRKGAKNRHGKRHKTCAGGCPYCFSNFTIASRREEAKHKDECYDRA